MSTRRKNVRLVLLGVVVLVAGATLVGGVVAGQIGGLSDPDELDSAVRNDPLVKVAEIEASGGLRGRGVFMQATSTGLLCLWDAPSAASRERLGGCNAVDDPLGGRKLYVSLAYDGGPSPAGVSDARLIGLASLDVEAVEVLMSDGTRRSVSLARAKAPGAAPDNLRAFGYRFRGSDLKRGVGPIAVLAIGSDGKEIDRQATGFAG